MVALTKHTQKFDLKKTPNNQYQLQKNQQNLNKNNPILKQVGNQYQDYSPIEVVPALAGNVPIAGTPFGFTVFATPDAPVDPNDCSLYPNSPSCGGNPFTFTFIGIEPAIVLDNCNLGIQLTPVIGFITLPPIQIVFHSNKPECNPDPPPPPEPYAPGSSGFCIEFLCSNSQHKGTVHCHFSGTAIPTEVYDFHYPGYQSEEERGYRDLALDAALYAPYSGSGHSYFGITDQLPDGSVVKFFDLSFIISNTYQGPNICVFEYDPGSEGPPYKKWAISWGAPGDLDTTLELGFAWGEDFTISFSCELPPPTPPPPPLPMQCCPSPFDPALLNLIIANQIKIMDTLGVDEYPASLPASLISKDEGFLGNLIPNPNVEIPNLTRLIGWCIEQQDALMGQWEIAIELKDVDPSTPGNQPKGFKLTNLAEATAEILQLLLQTFVNSEISVNVGTRSLLESGQIKQQDFKNYMLTQAIADYLGFNYKEVQRDLPLTFKPGETAFDKLLVEHTAKVSVAEITDNNTLQKALLRLLEGAALQKASSYRKLDTKSGDDPKQQFKDIIKKQAAMLLKLSDDELDASGDDNLDRFIKEAVIGFKDKTGIPLTDEPYGRDFDERPDIKRVN